MSCGDERIVVSIVDFVVEHNFRRLRRAVENVNSRFHPITQRQLVMKGQLHQRRIESLIHKPHVTQVVISTKLLTGILKIKRIGPMPYHVHRVHLAESDINMF